ncbi:circular bacteriocin, circularin A/uberolysin family [Granulicatella sp. zg-ZJ]|uniref:circular bacteriocin, circularin A/uberolysin family n=1 Tax=Granulicatella sp. zg-ZJ TaxID=2678504 RepID=UPI0013D4BD1B|nr:circular bacteriocin, circularin A/uberolysin family [Granulicatella sp. zg-ZJ]MBS4750910.1 circular bacteriocin, circularin A/uberolysin family [Carnobacteriaceae bacterium zg-ZUI78]NEW62782.1 circular bacteriocin, circularin A/uberolysin family [Granulicatella sp. zg-ZJ]
MKKTLFSVIMLILGIFFVVTPDAASMLGVNTYAAMKIVDAIMAGMSIWSIIGLVAVSGGALAVVWFGVKELIQRVGKKAAIAW